jgi:Ca2+-transporting ATPase
MTILTVVTIGLQLSVIYLPVMKGFFGLVPLSLQDLGVSFGLGVLVFIIVRCERVRIRKG